MPWIITWIWRLLVFFIGDQLKKLIWLILVTLPLFFLKQLFTRQILPWWLMVIVTIASYFFWF